jgi:hypothetical protein
MDGKTTPTIPQAQQLARPTTSVQTSGQGRFPAKPPPQPLIAAKPEQTQYQAMMQAYKMPNGVASSQANRPNATGVRLGRQMSAQEQNDIASKYYAKSRAGTLGSAKIDRPAVVPAAGPQPQAGFTTPAAPASTTITAASNGPTEAGLKAFMLQNNITDINKANAMYQGSLRQADEEAAVNAAYVAPNTVTANSALPVNNISTLQNSLLAAKQGFENGTMSISDYQTAVNAANQAFGAA